MLVKMEKNWIAHALLVGTWNGAATLEDSLVNATTTWRSNCTPGYFCPVNENYIYTKTCRFMEALFELILN